MINRVRDVYLYCSAVMSNIIQRTNRNNKFVDITCSFMLYAFNVLLSIAPSPYLSFPVGLPSPLSQNLSLSPSSSSLSLSLSLFLSVVNTYFIAPFRIFTTISIYLVGFFSNTFHCVPSHVYMQGRFRSSYGTLNFN